MSVREHAPYHERNLDQQILDALLRIEELLTKPAVVLNPEPLKEPEAAVATQAPAKVKRK